jgi:hypothetical protein
MCLRVCAFARSCVRLSCVCVCVCVCFSLCFCVCSFLFLSHRWFCVGGVCNSTVKSIASLMIGGGSLGTILSPEQKKRVTIAVELATQPKLLFLDEVGPLFPMLALLCYSCVLLWLVHPYLLCRRVSLFASLFPPYIFLSSFLISTRTHTHTHTQIHIHSRPVDWTRWVRST